ncbi:AAA family ATPase [Streptomyces sp. NPDC003247]|uniref:helix-turn-helix transcriptional regulator n=1 Tax=Streptomyces sp. NPDC003247 TaxID=3364677 RepID=UPI0036BBD69B
MHATPLVGRGAELERWNQVLDRGLDGAGGPAVVDIAGAAGIGKSRLLAEFCRRAERRGMRVLRGRAAEYEQHLPYRPFSDALADHGPELADPAAGQGRRGDRFGLHRSVARLLGRVAASGLVVALDDLHWADPASLELLDHLVRHPPHAPVVIVVARRDRQTSASLAAALTRGIDLGTVVRLDLGPLDGAACVDVLAPALAPGLPPGRAHELYAASDGNPLYFLALLQAGQTEGAGDTGRPLTSDGPPPARSAGLGSVLLDELTPLPPARRRTAEAVAVLGDRGTPALLARVTGRDEPGVDADLVALAARDLVRAGPGGRWTLRHPVLRTLVHESTDPPTRARMHRLAAEALAETGAPVTERAHHVERSLTGWDPQALAVLSEAAERSASTAPASSAHWLGVALAHLPDQPRHLALRRDLMLRRAQALGVSGGLGESRDLLHEVIAMSPPGEPDTAAVRASAVTLCAVMERHRGRYPESVALLRRELSRTPGPSPADAVAFGLELGSSAPLATAYPQVRADMARTLDLARNLGDEVAEAAVLAIAALGETYEGEMPAARETTDRAAALVDALTDHDLAGLCEPLARLSWAEAFLERYADAERHADRGLAVARRGGRLYVVPHLLLCKAHLHLTTLRIESAVELADEAETIARGIGSGELLAFVLANKAHALLYALPPGDRTALAVAEEAVAAAGTGMNWWASIAWCVLGQAALLGGDARRARTAVLRAGGDDLRRLHPSMRPLILEVLVTSALVTGDADSARTWAERARTEAEQLGLPSQRASALRSAAQRLLADGDTAAAATLFEEAAEAAGGAGAALWEAVSLLFGATPAASAGHPQRALALCDRARHLAAAGGAHQLTGLADMIRPMVSGPTASTDTPDPVPGAVPDPVPNAVPDPVPASLTPREREIAALVAAGLTTPAIAARLFLSPRTVESHLSRIYRKTGVTTRAALAALQTRSTLRNGTPRTLGPGTHSVP